MRVLVAAHDAGSANAVAPVVPLLIEGGAAVDALASGPAVGVFQRHGIAHIAHAPQDSMQGYGADVQAAFADPAPDAVLTGTSWGTSLDKAAVVVAREMGVVSVSVLDMWSYYRDRFVEPASGELRYLPDRLAVMDDLALQEAAADGIPAECMVVTGQPYLEATADALRSAETMTVGQTIRKGWLCQSGQGVDAAVVLFASDPVARDMGPGAAHYRGYDEYGALRGLVQALDSVRERSGRTAVLVLKPHPSQSRDEVASLQCQPGAGDALLTTEAPWPSIAAADVVVGMTSMLLLEAAIAGKPAISFQPSASAPGFFGTHIGAVLAAASVEALTDLLATSIASPAKTGAVPSALDMRGAARRVAGLVTQLASAHGTTAARRHV